MSQYVECPALINNQPKTLLQPHSTPVPKEDPMGQGLWPDPSETRSSLHLTKLPVKWEGSHIPDLQNLALRIWSQARWTHVNTSNLKQSRHNMTQCWNPDIPQRHRGGGSASQPAVTEEMQLELFTSHGPIHEQRCEMSDKRPTTTSAPKGPWGTTDLSLPSPSRLVVLHPQSHFTTSPTRKRLWKKCLCIGCAKWQTPRGKQQHLNHEVRLD